MAGIKDIYAIFKEVADAYSAIGAITYGKTYDALSSPTLERPFILIDSTPDFKTQEARQGSGYKAIKKEYKIKVFFFDNYYESEIETTEIQEKQDAMQQIFERYLGEVQKRMLEGNTGIVFVGRENDGFFGNMDINRHAMPMMYQTVRVLAPLDCTTGTFNY